MAAAASAFKPGQRVTISGTVLGPIEGRDGFTVLMEDGNVSHFSTQVLQKETRSNQVFRIENLEEKLEGLMVAFEGQGDDMEQIAGKVERIYSRLEDVEDRAVFD